jgi:hypothetical protein
MVETFGYIIVLVAIGLAIGVPLTVSRKDWFSRVLLVALLILAAMLVLNGVAIDTDYRDADGHMDCWPYCTTWQEVVNGIFWWGGTLFIALVIVVILRATFHGLRSRLR